jgi:hypothetical protein
MVIAMDLAELRARNKADRDQLQADLAQREIEQPFDYWSEVTREPPAIVHKTIDNASTTVAAEPASSLSSDELAEAVAEALAEESVDIHRIAMLEGQVSALLTLLGADPSRAKAAPKGLQNGTRFIEGPAAHS